MNVSRRRLLVLNNYSLDRVRREVGRGEKPAHHLFGIDHLARQAWDVEIAPLIEAGGSVTPEGFFFRLARKVFEFGDLPQQRHAWAARRRINAIYAPCQTQTGLLALARCMRVRTCPRIAVIAHHPIVTGRLRPLRTAFESLAWRGVDLPLALSSTVAAEISSLRGENRGGAVIGWGPDIDYYRPHRRPPAMGIVACGRTGRDFPILAGAASGRTIPLHILCLKSDAATLDGGWGENVKVTSFVHERDSGYDRLLPSLSAAAIHAIPLAPGGVLSGLTSLCDAIALGRAVLMTRNPHIDVDIEAEGFGRWIEPGDHRGWREAIVWAENHPREVLQMGERAADFAERKMNYSRFCTDLDKLLSSAIVNEDTRSFSHRYRGL